MVAVAGAGTRDEVRWAVWRDRFARDRQERGDGTHSGALFTAAGIAFNRHGRTVRRWLVEEPRPRKCFELDDSHLAYISLRAGNLHGAWEEQSKLGLVQVCYPTFRRAFGRLDPAIRAGLKGGNTALQAKLPYLTLRRPTDANVVFEIDHTLCSKNLIWDPVTNRRGHPWVTLVEDVASPAIVGFSITLGDSGNPTTESVFAALADTFLGRDYDGVFVGGMPEWIRFDQGSDFLHDVADAIDRLGGKPLPVEAYTPQHKPYIERAIRTMKRNILTGYPGYDEQMGEPARTRTPNSDLPTIFEFAALLDRDFRAWNQRFHRGVKAIPVQVYEASLVKATRLPEKEIALALFRRKKAVVQKDGVQFRGIMYQGQATFAHIGEEVDCGFLETRPDLLHLFDSNHGRERWLGKLEPAADAGAALARAVVEARRHRIETFERAQRNARDLRKELLVQLRGGDLEIPGAIPVPDTEPRGRRSSSRADDRKRDLARIAESDIWRKS